MCEREREREREREIPKQNWRNHGVIEPKVDENSILAYLLTC